MQTDATKITLRKPWHEGQSVFLFGPGGVGKSTLGRVLSERLSWPLIDLDDEFCDRVDLIGNFVSANGYDVYRQKNLSLAKRLVEDITQPSIFVTSSGFLAASSGSDDYLDAKALAASGYGIVLLPTLDLSLATAIIVDRQLRRGFNLRRDTEELKFRERFARYATEGDAIITSVEAPEDIAEAVFETVFGAHQR
jgi:shikimate kinase